MRSQITSVHPWTANRYLQGRVSNKNNNIATYQRNNKSYLLNVINNGDSSWTVDVIIAYTWMLPIIAPWL